jgi:predicted Fe-Mo cluster-binding NifX family protein
MMRRVAIPVTEDRLSEFFGECSHYEIYEIDRKIRSRREAKFPQGIVAARLPGWLEENGITDVITYRVNPQIIRLLVSKKVNLFVGIAIDTPQRLIENYLQGKLESDEKIIQEITYTTNNEEDYIIY